MSNRLLILSLYKRILRKADSFVYTDKEYFCERVYREFFFNKKATGKEAERLVKVLNFSRFQEIAVKYCSLILFY